MLAIFLRFTRNTFTRECLYSLTRPRGRMENGTSVFVRWIGARYEERHGSANGTTVRISEVYEFEEGNRESDVS